MTTDDFKAKFARHSSYERAGQEFALALHALVAYVTDDPEAEELEDLEEIMFPTISDVPVQTFAKTGAVEESLAWLDKVLAEPMAAVPAEKRVEFLCGIYRHGADQGGRLRILDDDD